MISLARSLLFLGLMSVTTVGAAAIEMELTSHLGDKVVYYQGDKIRFLLTINHDAYLYIYYQDAKGKLHALLPTSDAPPQYVQAGWFIPVPGAQYRFLVAEPFGEEKLIVFALSHRLIEFENNLAEPSVDLSLSMIRKRFSELAEKNHLQMGFALAKFTTAAQ